jgi:hypothetical protein
LPPPVSLIPRLVPLRPRVVDEERVPEAERDPAPDRVLPLVVSPAVSSIMPDESPPPVMLSVHSPIWSLRLLSWLLIWLRRDHRNRPAAAAPAAAAAAATGRSRTMSIIPQSLLWLRLLELLLRPPRLLLFGIEFLLKDVSLSNRSND